MNPLEDIEDFFTCDCHGIDHMMQTTLLGDQCFIVEVMKDWANISLWLRIKDGSKLFWDVVWNKAVSNEIVINRKEHKRFKELVNRLKDLPCEECNPKYSIKNHSH